MSEGTFKYPRVSEIIAPLTRSEFEKIPLEVLAHAAERGNQVHEYIKAMLTNDMWLPKPTEEMVPYIDSFNLWYQENVLECISTGERLYDDALQYCGEFDLIVKLKDKGRIVLIDNKLTYKNSSKSWPVQLAAYERLILSNTEISHFDTVMNLHLKKDGKIAQAIPYPDIKPYWEIFESALQCYDYFMRKETKC